MMLAGRSFTGLINPLVRFDYNDYFPGKFKIYRSSSSGKTITDLNNSSSTNEDILKRRNNIQNNDKIIFRKILRGWYESNVILCDETTEHHSEIFDRFKI